MRPCAGIGIQCAEPFVRLAVGGQVRQVHIVIALGQERIAQWSEYACFVAAEVVRENEVSTQSPAGS